MAIRENAERLRSGAYRASGRLESTHWNEGPKYEKRDLRHDEFDETVEADFDFDTNRSSFRSRRVSLGAPAPLKSTLETYRWYLDIPGLSVTLKGTEQRRTAALRLPTPWTEIWPNELTQRQPQPVYDPRLLGWVGLGFLGEPFQDLWENWFVKAELKSADEGAGIHRIEMWKQIEEGMSVVHTCWCDEQQGWQPVRSAFRWVYSAPTQNAEQRNREPQPLNETEQSWERHGDVWVIQSLSARLEAGSTKSTLQMTFDWQNVNQPIPEERFDWKSWSLGKDYHSLVDMRLGDGKEIDITDRRSPPYEVELDRPLVASKEDHGRFWMVLMNVGGISFLAGWVGSSWRKRR